MNAEHATIAIKQVWVGRRIEENDCDFEQNASAHTVPGPQPSLFKTTCADGRLPSRPRGRTFYAMADNVAAAVAERSDFLPQVGSIQLAWRTQEFHFDPFGY